MNEGGNENDLAQKTFKEGTAGRKQEAAGILADEPGDPRQGIQKDLQQEERVGCRWMS